MNKIPLEMFLKDHDETVIHRPIDKIIDQQIQAHARRHSEYGGKAQAHRVTEFQHRILGLPLGAPIKEIGRIGVSSVQNFPASPTP